MMKKQPALNDEAFRSALGFSTAALPRGGQELIMPELISLFLHHKVRELWLPFSLGPLAHECRARSIEVYEGREKPWSFRALYFGTPTVVDGKKLFEESDAMQWNLEEELRAVEALCAKADATPTCSLIASGLGSGDVKPHHRIHSMSLPGWSTPRCVTWKDFGEFQDMIFITVRENK